MIDSALNWLFKLLSLRQGVQVKVHRGFFEGDNTEYYFVKVVNASPQRDIEIAHIFIEHAPPVHIVNTSRPLPRRLKPDETYETWQQLSTLPPDIRNNAFSLFRVQLSNDKIYKSFKNTKVPNRGFVAGS
jgi:hypothetical protein